MFVSSYTEHCVTNGWVTFEDYSAVIDTNSYTCGDETNFYYVSEITNRIVAQWSYENGPATNVEIRIWGREFGCYNPWGQFIVYQSARWSGELNTDQTPGTEVHYTEVENMASPRQQVDTVVMTPCEHNEYNYVTTLVQSNSTVCTPQIFSYSLTGADYWYSEGGGTNRIDNWVVPLPDPSLPITSRDYHEWNNQLLSQTNKAVNVSAEVKVLIEWNP
jgi:hypothetical protein